jgi:hypothetical protein
VRGRYRRYGMSIRQGYQPIKNDKNPHLKGNLDPNNPPGRRIEPEIILSFRISKELLEEWVKFSKENNEQRIALDVLAEIKERQDGIKEVVSVKEVKGVYFRC